MPVELNVNGQTRTVAVEPRTSLLDCLREDLLLTGAQAGCEHGVCGACTVLIDGAPVRSCLMFAVQAQGRRIRTVEGLADGDKLHPLQASFIANHALQCGFCTSGMLATAYDVLSRIPDLDRDRIRAELGGNLCRCTGYLPIIQAIEDVHAQRSASAKLKAS